MKNIENSQLYTVTNRSAGRVVYTVPEDNVRREFQPNETKQIPYGELVKLSYQSGGRELMESYLQISAKDVVDNLNLTAEPEYFMSTKEVIDLLRTGSLDAFLDCLDFAPAGVIDLVKAYSVALPLADFDKRKALKEKTGFDVDAAVRNVESEKAEEGDAPEVQNKGRRVKKETSGRRTTANYGENESNIEKIEE